MRHRRVLMATTPLPPDLDNNGVKDLVVGAPGSYYDSSKTYTPGGIYILYMQRSTTTPVLSYVFQSLNLASNGVRGSWGWWWW
jgi:hypothetical protein